MNGMRRIKITDLNPNLICVLCGGYLIDATTLTECLHSFCKKCIVRYLESSKHCPVCDVMVHKTRPHQNIRSDKTLQDLVYKLVPGLYKNEMKRRRDYYTQHPEAAPKKMGEARGDENVERIIYTQDEHFSLALHFCSQGVKDERSVRKLTLPEIGAASKEPAKDVRYLQCPANVTISTIKKFIRLKYGLPTHYQIDIFHTDEALRDEYTLMDVAYIYTWRRREPLKLNYSVYEYSIKRMKLADTPLSRLGLEYRSQVKLETKQVTKPESKPVDNKPDSLVDSKVDSKAEDSKPPKADGKPTDNKPNQPDGESDKAPVKNEVAAKDDTKAPVKQEAGPKLPKKAGKEEKHKDKKYDVSEKHDVKPSGDVVVGHVAEVTATKPPSAKLAPANSPGKKFFPSKAAKPAAGPGVKVLQSSKPHTLAQTSFTKIKSAPGGGGAKASPVSKSVQDKGKYIQNSNFEAQKNASVQGNTLPAGQNTVVNVACKTVKAPAVAAENAVMEKTEVKKNAAQDPKGREAAGAAASSADVVTKTTRQLQPPPAASPATSITAPSSSATPVALTSSSRPTDSVTVSQSLLTVVSLPATIVTGSGATKPGLPASNGPSACKVVPERSAPAPANRRIAPSSCGTGDAGAAAAGGDASPLPAALAASSSPSPPMASATQSAKETEKQFDIPTSSTAALSAPGGAKISMPWLMTETVAQSVSAAPVSTSVSTVISCPLLIPAPVSRPVATPSQPTPVSTSQASKPTMTTSAGTNTVLSASSLVASVAVTKAQSSKPTGLDRGSPRSSPASSPAPKKARKNSPARPADIAANKFANPNSSNNSSNNNISSIKNNNVPGGPKVPVGSQTVVSNQAVPQGAGRVCNGMPPVVTRMPRVSNAATSVNTLSNAPKQPTTLPSTASATHKLPPSVSSPLRQSSASGTPAKRPASNNTAHKQTAPNSVPQKEAAATNTSQKDTVANSNTPQKQSSGTNTPQKQAVGNGVPKQLTGGAASQKQASSQKRPAGAQKQSASGVASEKPSSQSGTPQKSVNLSSSQVQSQGSVSSNLGQGHGSLRGAGGASQRAMALTRPSGASTPIPIQPAGLASSHPLVRATANDTSVVAAMARHATEIQQAFVQQQQQQLLLQQQLFEQQRIQQFLQQQQLFSMAVAARSQASGLHHPLRPQGSTTLTPIPIAPGLVVGAVPQYNGASTKTSTAGDATNHSEDQPKKLSPNNNLNKQQTSVSTPRKKPTEPKKNISDIANSLHKRVSQSQSSPAFQKPQQPSAVSPSDQRPPNAHSVKRQDSVSPTHGQTQAAHSSNNKSPTPAEQPSNKGEEEQPLNLSVVKDSPRPGGGMAERDSA